MIRLRQARLSKGYLPPRFSKGAVHLMNAIGELYMKRGEKVSGVKLLNPSPFCRALRMQQEGKTRLIILFHHCDKADAPSLMYALNRSALREGRRLGISFRQRPHAVFLYGKDVPNWAGAAATWFFPRLGHIPVINRGLCRESIDDIRRALRENRFPLALAPEGQVTYHAHRVSALESGLSHMAEWAAEHGPVRILPVALAYDYGDSKGRVIEKAVSAWMAKTGLNLEHRDRIGNPYPLLMEMIEKTLTLLEESFSSTGGADTDSSADKRISLLIETILREAEKIGGIKKSGTVLDRVFRLRYRGVDTWFPEQNDPAFFTEWERSRSDYDCLKASLYTRCSQIVDVLEYIHCDYISDRALNNRHCEFVLNILDLVNRFQGGDIGTRLTPEARQALVLPAEAIDFSGFDRSRGKKELFRTVDSCIRKTLQDLSSEIEGYLN